MKKFFIIRLITAILFICVLFTYSIMNFMNALDPIKAALSKVKPAPSKQFVDSVNSAIDENVYGKYSMVEGYGYLQKLLGKNEEANFEVVKDNSGSLHYTYFTSKPNPVGDLADRVERLKEGIKDKKARLVVLMPPDKNVRGYTKFPKGIPYSYANETADNFLKAVREKQIDTLDFRTHLLNSGIPAKDLFFKTDHHWKIQTAFWAFSELVSYLNRNDQMNLDPDHYYTNIKNYNQITYKHSYLGSLGAKTGTLYAGIDDFTLIYPKFKTDYTFHSQNSLFKINTSGRFEDALMNGHPFHVSGNNALFSLESDKYFTYLYGNQALVHIVNKQNPKGPKVLFIKDSMSVPLAAFFSTVCSDVYLVDPRYYHGDMSKLINSYKHLDDIFVSIYPEDLNKEFFPY
ncbi:alginate O-acetyltransferase AlgX-related protein [Sporolactobacillus laevolacticus]|uniref:Membrane protein n=1 Tax=Sporolactobacillus laevolacticus DSM 442 TaxID=1395513 RepID=V6IYX3_9BACL|nr:membrane protein [Sporolactobacillus laevolacticus]EST12698.1 membrane protein [Sporolactobacillus laevolacticus DSM 442]